MVISERAQAKEEVRREVNEIRSAFSNLISPIRSPQPASNGQDIIRPRGRNLLRELVAAGTSVSLPSTSRGFQPFVNRPGHGTISGSNGGPQTVSTSNPSLSSGVSAGGLFRSQSLISTHRSQDIIRPAGRSLLRELVASPMIPVVRPTTSHGFQPFVYRTGNGTTSGSNGGSQTVSISNPSFSSGVSAGVVHESQPLLSSIFDGNLGRAFVPIPLSERARDLASRSSISRRTGTSRRSRFSPVVTENFDRDPDIPAYQYNPKTFRYSELTLRQACSVMSTFDMDKHFRKIVSTLCKYSIRIYGLEDCEPRDLTLAVFFLLEKYFDIQPEIELCVRGISDSVETNVTGVVFERTASTQNIMENLRFLRGSPYTIERNFDTAWITENLDF